MMTERSKQSMVPREPGNGATRWPKLLKYTPEKQTES